jgi:acetylornithine/succinyldiaminopimelate/putrescine aminotransferase
MRRALDDLDIGNFMLLASARTELAEKLARMTDGALPAVVFTASGAEANEAAMKAARVASGRRKFVCFEGAYHGDTLATLAVGGDQQKKELYGLDGREIVTIPFNDLPAARAAISTDTAALIAEPTVTQLGFPEPATGYWAAVAEHCRSVGAYIILDEVQTGGGATGTFWHYQQLGFVPDMLVNGKWTSGGYFPNSFMMMRADIHRAFTNDVFMPHPSTFGGSELGCLVTSAAIDVLKDPALLRNVARLSQQFADGFEGAPFRLNRNGLCMALIDDRRDNFASVRLLSEAGIITIPALHDRHAVEFRPILTLTETEAADIIRKVRQALG